MNSLQTGIKLSLNELNLYVLASSNLLHYLQLVALKITSLRQKIIIRLYYSLFIVSTYFINKSIIHSNNNSYIHSGVIYNSG